MVEPLLSGAEQSAFSTRDLEYVRDLGLVAQDTPLRIANPIYAEVVPRELTYATQAGLVQDPAWYVHADGSLDVEKLMAAFQTFFREHSEHWVGRFQYREAGPQLLLQAFFATDCQQRWTHRARVWPRSHAYRSAHDLAAGRAHAQIRDRVQNSAQKFETHHRRGFGKDRRVHGPLRCGEGSLVIFDRRKGKRWKDKIFHCRRASDSGVEIDVWGM